MASVLPTSLQTTYVGPIGDNAALMVVRPLKTPPFEYPERVKGAVSALYVCHNLLPV